MTKLPVLFVEGETLPEVWEKSLLQLYDKGINYFKESYKPGVEKDEILECSMKMVVRDPFKEPMLHMGCMGVETYRQYVSDVLEGTKNHMIGKGYDYTYNERLFKYEVVTAEIKSLQLKVGSLKVNQIDEMEKRIKKALFSNRAQAVTWQPWRDNSLEGPPCLQRVWCKVFDGELELHTSWRSRDAFNAAFLNMLGMVHLQKKIADDLGVKVGQYTDDSDSYHVYSSMFPDFERFVKATKSRIEQEEKGEKPKPRWINSSYFKKNS